MTDDRLLEVPFWFLRHGQTDWNAANRTQGNVEIPLNATGLQQAREAAARLNGRRIATLWTSPLGRACETATIVGEALGLVPEVDPDLREAAFGAHEGEVMGAWFEAWVQGTAIPEGGEGFGALRARARAALNRILAGPGPALVVAHGGFFRAVRAEMGLPAAVGTANATPIYCSPADPAWDLQPL